MTPKIDQMLQASVLLRRIVGEISAMLEQCEYKSTHAPEILRPIYKQLGHVLEADGARTEGVVLEMADYLAGQDAKSLSAQQKVDYAEFMELLERPLYAGLCGKQAFVSQITSLPGLRDC